MADSYFTQASNYAKKAADEYRSTFDSTLNDLLTMSNLQKEQAKNSYNNLLNQINANRANLQQNYETNARQSYVNKLLADQQTTDTLSRMNLNQSGFRLTQDTLTNNRYDASLNQLALAQDQGLRDLDTQGLNALNDYNNNLLKLDLDYNSKLAALKEQINDNVTNYYNKEYDRFYNDLKYQDQLKQQAIENDLKQQQINASLKKSSTRTSNTTNTTNTTYWTNGGNGANGQNGVNGINGQNGQNGQTLKYTAPTTTKNDLSDGARQWLASFLLRNGSRDESGKYNASNTSVSRDVLARELNNNTSLTDAEKNYIKGLFGVTGDLGGSTGSTGSTGSAGNATARAGNTPSGVDANGMVTLQGTYSPKLSNNGATQWFNNLTNSISKNKYKIDYNDLIGQLQYAAQNNLIDRDDTEKILKSFGLTEDGSAVTYGAKQVQKPESSLYTKDSVIYNYLEGANGKAVTLNIDGSNKQIRRGNHDGAYYYWDDKNKKYTKITNTSQLNQINNQLQKRSSTMPVTASTPSSRFQSTLNKSNVSTTKSSAVNKFTSILNSLKFGK